MQHTFFVHFFCRCFARLQRETSRYILVPRFMEEMSYVFSFTFFSLPLIFTLHWWPLAFSQFVTAATKLSCCCSNKKMSPVFFVSHSRSLSPFFSLSFAGLPPTFPFSLSFSCSIFQLCGHAGQWILTNYFRQHGYRDNFCFLFSSLLTL